MPPPQKELQSSQKTPLTQETKVQNQRTKVQQPQVHKPNQKSGTNAQNHDCAGTISYNKGLESAGNTSVHRKVNQR